MRQYRKGGLKLNSALNVYKKNQIQTNTPEKLVLMLYDGAIKFIGKAIESIKEKNIQDANDYLIRSQNILAELMSGINFEAGEIADNLYCLYEYIYHQLMQANIKKEKKYAENALNMIKELKDTWIQMLKENNNNLHQRKTANG
jgi:flagellar protein FliS